MHRSATVLGVMLLVLSASVPALGTVGAQPAGQSAAELAAQDSVECSFPLTVTDSTGHETTIESEPQTVVTLGPSAAQTMWEIGAKSKVVGVSSFASYLDGADSREVVLSGFPATVNVEKVVGMNPDLVLAANIAPKDSVQQIRNAGIDVYRFEMATSIETIYEKTKLFGKLTGACQGAEETIAQMRDRVNTIETAVAGEDEPRVFYGTGAGFTAGPNTFIGQVIAKAGGHNIATDANASQPYFKMSAEFIVEQDPEYVVVSVPPSELGQNPRSYIPNDSAVRNTTAWEEGNIVVVNTNHLSQPAPRIVQPMTEFAKAFHPDAYAEANTTSTTAEPTTDTSTATPPAATTGAPATGESSDGTNTGTPGFGIATALVAVLGAALVARR